MLGKITVTAFVDSHKNEDNFLPFFYCKDLLSIFHTISMIHKEHGVELNLKLRFS